jgi:WD40 repeat protein
MKKIILISLACLTLTTHAQFIETNPPTEFELKLNNTSNVTKLMALAAEARKQKNHEYLQKTMEKVVALNPNNPALNFQLAEAYALNDEKTKAFNALIELQKQGLYFDLQNNINFANIKKYPVFEYIKNNIDVNAQHFGEGKESFNINKSFSGLLFENIVFDANSQSFLMGSLRDGSVIKVNTSNGAITRLIPAAKGGVDGPWATLDLAVDEKNDVLWVASSAITQFGKMTKVTTGMAGIFKYKLSTGEFIKSYITPESKRPSLISRIHLTNQGKLYLLDIQNKEVLAWDSKTDKISLALSLKQFNDVRSLTTDETGNMLYLSDNERGIMVIDMKNQKTYAIENNEALNLIGITDLTFDDNGLIIIQSGFSPERIMRLELNQDKNAITNIFPIESANPAFDSPSYGVVVGEGFYYIANSQTPKTNMYGGLLKGQQWQNMAILSSPKHYKEKDSLNYQKEIELFKKETKSN